MAVITFSGRRCDRHPATWWKRAGAAGFTFFLAKGLLWLLAPAVLYLIRE